MKTRIYCMALALSFFVVLSAQATQENAGEKAVASQPADANKAEPQIDMAKVSYIIGTQLGQSFMRQGIDINIDSLVSGLKDILAGKESALSKEETQKIIDKLKEKPNGKPSPQKSLAL